MTKSLVEKCYYCKTKQEYMSRFGAQYSAGELWDFSLEDFFSGAIEYNPDLEYWIIDGRVYEALKR